MTYTVFIIPIKVQAKYSNKIPKLPPIPNPIKKFNSSDQR
jgi:hypothetical protein